MTRKKRKPIEEPRAAEREAPPPPGAEAPPGPPAGAADSPEALRAERDDLLARLQRVSADYLNYQKRVQRDVTQAREFANEQLVLSLLPVLDDMERALQAARANHDPDDPLLAGMQLVHAKALETLGKFGLTAIEAAGKPFDPAEHAAVMQEPSDRHEPQTVLREVQKGYRLKGRTLRPSAVIVSKAPEPGGREQGPEGPPPAGPAAEGLEDRRDADADV